MNITDPTPTRPSRSAQDDTKENLTIRALREREEQEKAKDESGHMGAKESQVEQTKPPTEELGDLTDRPLDKGNRKDTDYDPVDEITPG